MRTEWFSFTEACNFSKAGKGQSKGRENERYVKQNFDISENSF